MRSPAVRFLLGVVLAVALCSSVFASGSSRPAAAPATWQVQVGAASTDQALQAQAYGPSTLTVNIGDTVTWSLNTFVHTVTFLSGGEHPPEAVPGEGNLLLLNPAVAFPSGGPTYDGSGYVNSGMLQEPGQKFSLTMNKAGTFSYICLLHPGMAGAVGVQPEGSAAPMTQAQVDAQATSELNAALQRAEGHRARAQHSSSPRPDGTTAHTVVNGIGGQQGSVLRYLPGEVSVKAGDSISWPVQDPHEIHTVTFYDPAGPVPLYVEPRPQQNGPPQLILHNVMLEGGTRVERQGAYNSGVLANGQSYTFTFPNPGVYSYVCVLHAGQGMFGKVNVQAAGAAPLPLPATGEAPIPVALPNTGASPPLHGSVALAAGAAVLLLLGLLTVRRAARR